MGKNEFYLKSTPNKVDSKSKLAGHSPPARHRQTEEKDQINCSCVLKKVFLFPLEDQ